MPAHFCSHPRLISLAALTRRRSGVRTLSPLASMALLLSCSEASTAPTGEELSVCHFSDVSPALTTIRASELVAHQMHGDYVAQLFVDKSSAALGDSIHFTRIGDAIAAARATRLARNELARSSCRITISVAAGIYQGSVKASADPSFERLPLVIDVPDVTLRGSFVMPVDAKGRAVGKESAAATATILVANPGLASVGTGALDKFAEPLIVINSHPTGSLGDGTWIQGFVFRSGNEATGATLGGNAVWAMRSQRLVVQGNQVEAGFAEPIEMRASSALVERNLLRGTAQSCSFCMFGPGNYQIVANRQSGASGRLSVLVFPTISAAVPPGVEPLLLPATATVTVAVTNNEFRDHQEVPFGIGVRVAAIGPSAPDVLGNATVVLRDNDLSNNRFAVVAEAGFVGSNPGLQSNIDLRLDGNNLSGSCQTGLLITTSGQGTATGLSSGPSLRKSAYNISLGGDIAWNDVWYSHPAGSDNTLDVDGLRIGNGSRVPYDRNKACPIN